MAKTRTQITAQINKLEERLAALRVELVTAPEDGYVPEVGDVVSFEYGRKEKRDLTGKVLGINDTGKGIVVTVFVEDGANSELCKVYSNSVRRYVEEVAEQEPADVTAE